MDFVPDNTVNKLILLYVLDKMEIPLTENSILEICSSQNNWVNWMDCKDLLAQLIVSKFVYKPNTDSAAHRKDPHVLHVGNGDVWSHPRGFPSPAGSMHGFP